MIELPEKLVEKVVRFAITYMSEKQDPPEAAVQMIMRDLVDYSELRRKKLYSDKEVESVQKEAKERIRAIRENTRCPHAFCETLPDPTRS